MNGDRRNQCAARYQSVHNDGGKVSVFRTTRRVPYSKGFSRRRPRSGPLMGHYYAGFPASAGPR